MTEEERQARLAEMMGNAAQHERARADRVAIATRSEQQEEREAAAAAAAAAARGGGDAFKGAAMKEVFGSMGGAGNTSLEARISSRRHYQDRGGL